jgi:hypothetical protein
MYMTHITPLSLTVKFASCSDPNDALKLSEYHDELLMMLQDFKGSFIRKLLIHKRHDFLAINIYIYIYIYIYREREREREKAMKIGI